MEDDKRRLEMMNFQERIFCFMWDYFSGGTFHADKIDLSDQPCGEAGWVGGRDASGEYIHTHTGKQAEQKHFKN